MDPEKLKPIFDLIVRASKNSKITAELSEYDEGYGRPWKSYSFEMSPDGICPVDFQSGSEI